MPASLPTRLVLDTNIVMDLLHFDDRPARPIKAAMESGRVRCFTDSACLGELERVSGYPEFALDDAARRALIGSYRRCTALCEPLPDEDYALPKCRDEDDQKFLVLAARCHADFLLTRDKLLLRLDGHRHKPPPFSIVTAVAACRLLELA